MLHHYRFDFNSSGLFVAPSASYEWDYTSSDWGLRGIVDAPISVSDAKTTLYVQVDSSTTNLGDNGSTDMDIYLISAPVEMATTGQLGGRFDSTTGAYYEYTGHGDDVLASFGVTDAPPKFKLRLDNNSGSTARASVFVTFNVNNY